MSHVWTDRDVIKYALQTALDDELAAYDGDPSPESRNKTMRLIKAIERTQARRYGRGPTQDPTTPTTGKRLCFEATDKARAALGGEAG